MKRNPRARFLKFSTEEEAWASLEETTEFSSPPTATATLDSPIRGGGGDDGAHTSAQKRRKGKRIIVELSDTLDLMTFDNFLNL